jgi:sugar phosphate isomerase/epimerase
MTNRRTFIKQASLFSAGLFALPGIPFRSIPAKEIGLQLYTVRDQMKQDLTGTLNAIAEIGYRTIEAAGYDNGKFYNLDPVSFSSLVSSTGMKMLSSHTTAELPSPDSSDFDSWQQVTEDTAATGARYLVYAYLSEDKRKSMDYYKRLAEKFNMAGEICMKNGLVFCYHNHDFEFEMMDGKIPYDLLLSNTDPQLVKMELDLYWTIRAGKDPLEYFKNYPGRFELWHVKDMEPGKEQFFAEVGQGTINFGRIFAHAAEAGMRHFFVEQDRSRQDPLKSIKTSFEYLNNASFVKSSYAS